MARVNISYVGGKWCLELDGKDITNDIIGFEFKVPNNAGSVVPPELVITPRPDARIQIEDMEVSVSTVLESEDEEEDRLGSRNNPTGFHQPKLEG